MQKSPQAFRTISEVAGELDVPQHVLRFWESKFAQVKPMKRAGGRRYYRPADIMLLNGVKALLYEEGYTIRGVQKVFREHGVRYVAAKGGGPAPAAPAVLEVKSAAQHSGDGERALHNALEELMEVKKIVAGRKDES